MKKQSKLLIGIVLSAALITVPLTGCSSKPAEETSGTKAQTTAQQTSKEPKVIKWYTNSDDNSNVSTYKYDKIVEAFQQKYTDVKVEMKSLVGSTNTDEYVKKSDMMIAAGEQIDILNYPGPAWVIPKVDAGVLEPLDEYAKKAGIDDLANEYNGIMKINGKVYSIPNNMVSWMVYLNKDLLDAAGLPIPPLDWTWNDYRDYAKKLTKGEGQDKVYGSYFHTWGDFNAIGDQSKIKDNKYYKADGSANFEDPVFRTFFKFRYDLEQVDKVQVPYVDIMTKKLAYRDVFFGGKIGMMPQGSWFLSDIKDTTKYPHTFKTAFAAMPRVDETCVPNTSNNTGAGGGYCVNAASKYKEEAFNLISFITSEGYDISKSFLTPWKKGNMEAIGKEILGSDANLYDIDSYKSIMGTMKENIITNVKSYDNEITDIYNQETSKYFTGGQSLDDTIKNLQKRATGVIDKNKK